MTRPNGNNAFEETAFFIAGTCLIMLSLYFSLAPNTFTESLTFLSCVSSDDCGQTSDASQYRCGDYDGNGTKECVPGIAPPLSEPIWRFLSLGHERFGAALAWLQIVQFIGRDHSEFVQYIGLESWLDLLTNLDPMFRSAYFVGGILLATAPNRAQAADRLLEKAQNHFEPSDNGFWEILQWRGFIAYYGMLDTKAAIAFYQQSYENGGPTYFRHLVKKLEKQELTCENMYGNIQQHQQSGSSGQYSGLIESRLDKLMIHCHKKTIDRAATAYYLQTGQYASDVSTLFKAQMVQQMPPTIPGKCWTLYRDRVDLSTCK